MVAHFFLAIFFFFCFFSPSLLFGCVVSASVVESEDVQRVLGFLGFFFCFYFFLFLFRFMLLIIHDFSNGTISRILTAFFKGNIYFLGKK